MHTEPMLESAGTFGNAKSSDRKCPKCSAAMTVETWESSCGGYEDYKFTCSNTQCGHVVWVDGIDS